MKLSFINTANRIGRIFLLFIFMAFAQTIAGQTSRMHWGPIVDKKNNKDLVDLYTGIDGNIMLTKAHSRNYDELSLEEFSPDSLKLLNSNSVNLPAVNGLQPEYYSTIHLRENSIIISTAFDKKTNQNYILGFPILPNLDIAKQPKTLGILEVEDQRQRFSFKISVPPGNTHFALLIPTIFEEGKNGSYELRYFDNLMEQIYAKDLKFPYRADDIRFEDLLLDGDSAAYLLISTAVKNIASRKTDNKKARNFKLATFFPHKNKLTELELSLGLKWVYDARLSLTYSELVQVSGYFSNYSDLILSGTFALNLNRKTQQIESQGLKPFSRDFKSQFRSGSGVIDDSELGNFQLDMVYNLPNGNTQLICEKRYTHTSTIYNPATATYMVITTYRSDNLLVTEIDEKGDIIFNVNIPKYQSSNRDFGLFSSYSFFRWGENTFLLYNDNARNKEEDELRQMESPDHSDAVLIKIDKKGSAGKTILYNHSNEKTVLRPEFYLPVEPGIILYTQSSQNFRLARLSLTD